MGLISNLGTLDRRANKQDPGDKIGFAMCTAAAAAAAAAAVAAAAAAEEEDARRAIDRSWEESGKSKKQIRGW